MATIGNCTSLVQQTLFRKESFSSKSIDETVPLQSIASDFSKENIDEIMEVPLDITVELGRTAWKIKKY